MQSSSEYNWKQKQILVVEDDESSAFLLGVILEETGASVEYTSDGEEAVAYMKTHPETDLILMDIQLPEMDGFTATRHIKSIASKVIVIAQTAYAFSIDHQQAEEAGCDDFLTKPLNPAILLNKMDNYLS